MTAASVAVGAVAMLASAMLAVPALAGAPPDGGIPIFDELSEERRSQLEALIPQGFPGKYDLKEGDDQFGQLIVIAGLEGENADVEIGSGSKLTGPCGGWAYSYDGDGALLDAALDPGGDGPPVDLLDGGQAFTSGNPFKVDTEGRVLYFGFMPRSGDGPEDHRWKIKTGGISLDKGGDPNENLKNNAVGEVNLGEDLPFPFRLTTQVKGDLQSLNLPPCIGEGHVEFQGPWFSPIGIAATALFLGGVLGLLFNARPAYTFKGTM